VSAVLPNGGATGGGTKITVQGANFTTGATVTIGGVPATGVAVQSSSTISAVTGPHDAGTADVTVAVGGMAATLKGGFTYAVIGPADNPAPRIASIKAQGSRANQPAQFADVGEEITITASVSDAETPKDQLVFEWSADSGTITGSGASVKWRADDETSTPVSRTIELTVIERYATTDASGNIVLKENRATGSTTVSVHDSEREVSDMAVQFLTDFSISSIPPSQVVRNFTKSCRGRESELEDVEHNRRCFVINAYKIGDPSTTIRFDGSCRGHRVDACVSVPARWEVTGKACDDDDSDELEPGERGVANGTDWVTAVYENSRWYLCDSNFEGAPTMTFRFMK
jgi:hypothetical protein